MIVQRVNVGRPQLISNQFGQTINSGIGKKSVPSVTLFKKGFEGDKVADLKNHGGDDRAVCFYPFEHYDFWEKFCERNLQIPAFGENITVTKMAENEVFIGDIYQLGNAIVQITQGRIPCATIDRFNRVNGMLTEVIRTGKTGYFAKVLEEGDVETGANISLMERTQSIATISQVHHLFFHDRTNKMEIEKVASIPELAEAMKEKFNKLINH